MKVLLGISGGIAAYKSAELVRALQQQGDDVQAVLTRSARAFVTPLTLATLSGKPVLEDLFAPPAAAPAAPVQDDAPEYSIEHIAIAQTADVVLVAPATANLLARMAHGLADDFLTTILLATPAPVVVAPAMNVQMWRHPATQANLALLRQRGVSIVPPGQGYLACGMQGEGRMADLTAILAALRTAAAKHDLSGETVLITAGPTREALDPVRYLTNRSSGRMGYALADAARRRGARVVLVSGPVALPPPPDVELVAVETAADMLGAAEAAFDSSTIAIFAAAVADFRPAAPSAGKIKRTAAALSLELVPNPDILASLGERKTNQVLIGFAAETDPAHALDHARAKLQAKRCDLIVLNDVSRPGIGFDSRDNEVTLVTLSSARDLPRAPKTRIADQILDAALDLQHALHHARSS